MGRPRELLAFSATLAALVGLLLGESLAGGKVLSPADVLFVSASFREFGGPTYEPANRLLTDPVLQFEPWLEFNRAMLRRGRLPLWNDRVGGGAPHLANGQSAVFDPFNLALALLADGPEGLAWACAGRLWVAGLGMFLLARAWGLGPWGRWFAGLTFPLCGFLVAWLLYPVTASAIWLPWLFWAGDRALDRPRPRAIATLALVVGATLLGGHVQTAAHALLAAGLYALVRRGSRRGMLAWTTGVGLGVTLASIQVIPLAAYLSRSPVWADRRVEQPPAWRLGRPRPLDAACTALPYLYGSQRRGHPNLARALGVHNLNESAGGFAGLATLIWLAPLGVWAGRGDRRVRFLAALGGFGALAAFEVAPAPNLLRLFPVLDVTDHRRLTLWVAFALTLLGGVGLDRLGPAMRAGWGRRWTVAWVVAAAAALAAAGAVRMAEPRLRARAIEHYAKAAAETPGADASAYRDRAERQVRQALAFVPRYLALAGAHLLVLAGLAAAARRGAIGPDACRAAVGGIVLVDLLGFGLGLNPALDPALDRPVPPVIAYLKRELGPGDAILGVGEELPPNVALRYGLADARNYDSVELERAWARLEALYEPDRPVRTSRRAVTWAGVLRAIDALRASGVAAVVGASPPPPGPFDRVDRIGSVWVARLTPAPPVRHPAASTIRNLRMEHGKISLNLDSKQTSRIEIRQTFDPGWRAAAGGVRLPVRPSDGGFLTLDVPAGTASIRLRYEPPEVRIAAIFSLGALGAIGFTLTGLRPLRSTRIVRGAAWTEPSHAVRIDAGIRSGTPLRKITEARGADGPLHV